MYMHACSLQDFLVFAEANEVSRIGSDAHVTTDSAVSTLHRDMEQDTEAFAVEISDFSASWGKVGNHDTHVLQKTDTLSTVSLHDVCV